MAAKGARMPYVRVLSKRHWTAVGLPFGVPAVVLSLASVCSRQTLHASQFRFLPSSFSHGFTFQNAKKASRTHNTFKLAAAQIFTYYHAFTGHQYTSKKGSKGRR
jgi:hypothetical protein